MYYDIVCTEMYRVYKTIYIRTKSTKQNITNLDKPINPVATIPFHKNLAIAGGLAFGAQRSRILWDELCQVAGKGVDLGGCSSYTLPLRKTKVSPPSCGAP